MIDRSAMSVAYGPERAWMARPHPGAFEGPGNTVAAFDSTWMQVREEQTTAHPDRCERCHDRETERDPASVEEPKRAKPDADAHATDESAPQVPGCSGGTGGMASVAVAGSGCQENPCGAKETRQEGSTTDRVSEGVQSTASSESSGSTPLADPKSVSGSDTQQSKSSGSTPLADPKLVLGNDTQPSDGIQILSSGSSRTVDKSGSGDLAHAGGVDASLSQGNTEKDCDTSLHGVSLSTGSALRTVAAADLGNAIGADNDRPAEGDHLRDAANGMVIERGDPLDQAPVVGFDQVSGDGPLQEPRVPKESLIQNLAQRLTEQGGFLRSAGSRSWTVHVEPDSLGAVRLDISVREHGVTADITTTHPIMRELLDQHQGQLRQALADHGFSVDRFSVNVGDPEQRSSGRSWDRGGQSRPWAGPPEHGPVVRSTSTAGSPSRHTSEGGALNVVNVYI